MLFAACSSAPVAPRDPKGVVDAFLAARNSGDTEVALAMVDDNAVVQLVRFGFVPSQKEQLRYYWTTPGLLFRPVRAPVADGDHVVWIERVEITGDVLSQDPDYAHSVHTYKVSADATVEGGRITSLIEQDVQVCPMVC
jgi:hypothetical protein